jgi:hypothetical protein
MAFMNDRCSVFLVLGLAGESKLVLGLAVGDLVNAVGGSGERGSGREKFDETRVFGMVLRGESHAPEPLVRSAYEAR